MEILLVIIIVVCIWYLCRHIPLRSRVTKFCELFLSEYIDKHSYVDSAYNVFEMDFPSYIARSMANAVWEEAIHVAGGTSGLSAHIHHEYGFNYQVVVFVAYYRIHTMVGADFTPKQQKVIFDTIKVTIDPDL